MNPRIDVGSCALVVVDLQERLLAVVPRAAAIIERGCFLVETAKLLDVPILTTEQYPKGLGPTVPLVRDRLADAPLEKTSFSIYGDDGVRAEWDRLGKPTAVLLGAETHVCVMQSAFDLIAAGVRVVVAVDATGSRFETDESTALERMRQAGVVVTTVEAVAFDWLGTAKHPAFKSVSALVRGLAPFPKRPIQ